MQGNGSNINFKRIGVPPTKSTNLSVRITLFSRKTSGPNAKAMALITGSVESAETSAELRIEVTGSDKATVKSADNINDELNQIQGDPFWKQCVRESNESKEREVNGTVQQFCRRRSLSPI